jgi:DNA-directed RNA polymerase specialized sigma24 family protein
MISSSLERVKNGDLEAFSTLYDFSYNRVYASIFHRTLDVSLTEDIVSEVYMKAIKNLKTLKAQSE